jgi:nitrate reductase assembly molybdenum cofactor insertion protein NarJ
METQLKKVTDIQKKTNEYYSELTELQEKHKPEIFKNIINILDTIYNDYNLESIGQCVRYTFEFNDPDSFYLLYKVEGDYHIKAGESMFKLGETLTFDFLLKLNNNLIPLYYRLIKNNGFLNVSVEN